MVSPYNIGKIQKHSRDFFFEGTCDDGVNELIKLMGLDSDIADLTSKISKTKI
jgi:hypothetical protein